MLRKIAKEQVLDRLRFENPWWSTARVDEHYTSMPRRMYFQPFCKLAGNLEVNRSVVLMGPRRVGKTVLLQHWVQSLLEEGVLPRKIIFITIESPVYTGMGLEELFSLAKAAAGFPDDQEGWYVVFDEIQYLRDWDVHLKTLVDSYRNVRFVVSGSAAATLQYKSKESGAGRFSDFLLPPVTFYEFIEMQGLGAILKHAQILYANREIPFFEALDIRQFNEHFLNYIHYGGYPEAVFSEAVRKDPQRFIRQDVVDKVLLRDLPSLYGITDVQELNAFFTSIAYNTAQEFSPEALSKQSGVNKSKIKKYLSYLEAAFLIRIVRRIDQSGKRFKRDNVFKIYLTNPSIRSALFAPIDPLNEMMGASVETAVYAQWMHRQNMLPYYARWAQGEVDMVHLNPLNMKPSWALEIKWSDQHFENPTKLKSLLAFCAENQISDALVTTIQTMGKKRAKGVELTFLPASTYAYSIGFNTAKQQEGFEQIAL